MCSACYQKKRFDSAAQKVHHAVPALATAWVHSSHCALCVLQAAAEVASASSSAKAAAAEALAGLTNTALAAGDERVVACVSVCGRV